MKEKFSDFEKGILDFWRENEIFEKSIMRRQKRKDFVFYEGPPTANAKPGIHHVLARVFKDIICRYKTMQGFRVLRKAGWDTHGLPVELEVEKKLGLKKKRDIEKYGIAKFNKYCQESVWQYKKDWEDLTERIGFWLDLKNPYITYTPEYIETVWFILKEIWKKGLLYEDFKVVPWCPRCETALSAHEVAQGYKKIKEPAIFVKFPISHSQFPNTSLLAWTTTPWTLPGNVAVAVNPRFNYVKVKIDNEFLILAQARKEDCRVEGEVVEEFQGKELLGIKYKPLFKSEEKGKKENIYKVVEGDFVSLEEGTGLVHIAPAFGQEDLEVGKENNLPMILNVTEEGKFKETVKPWAGERVSDERLNDKIIENLRERKLLLRKELYEHDYPFCWRCGSKLIYYAKKSWFIKMTAVKEKLLKNNEKINWIPAHLKEGRFGEWIQDLKDWTLSRERFWGTPLPIWRCESEGGNGCGNIVIIGSREDLGKQKFTTNRYFILRHGQTIYQKEKRDIIYPPFGKDKVNLTQEGKKEIRKVVQKLKKERLDLIFSSDLLRARETAEILARQLDLEVILDKRLRDVNLGVYHGKKKEEFYQDFPNPEERFYKSPPQGESWLECKKRILEFIEEVNKKHQGKRILIVSHGDPLWLLEGAMKGLENKECLRERERNFPGTGELRELEFKRFPFNEEGKLDFHRPAVDEIRFHCPKCKRMMKRVPEVIDVWFDSGAMPFAQNHWPFSQHGRKKTKDEKVKLPVLFPADYICEAVDQTRGWFYTLLAISTLLEFGPAYKNVISLGLVLDEKGEKMSKSKGNVVNPWKVIEKYGADTVRWYFYTINQPGDAKRFSEKDLERVLKKFIMTYWNSFIFFKTYGKGSESIFQQGKRIKISNLLDKWMISKLNRLILEITEKLNNYDVTNAGRAIEKFIVENLSQWYIRRSRTRFQKPKSKEELREVSEILGFVLLTLTKLTAPFVPFLSERIYQGLHDGEKKINSPRVRSVHLENWPTAREEFIDRVLEEKMEKVRKIVSLALNIRAECGMRIRQPLSQLKIKKEELKNENELIDLIKEEVNVKEVIFDPKINKEVELETKITAELKEEGEIREVIRNLQDLRKKGSLTPKERIQIFFSGPQSLTQIFIKNAKIILKETKALTFQLGKAQEDVDVEKETEIDHEKIWLGIKVIRKKGK